MNSKNKIYQILEKMRNNLRQKSSSDASFSPLKDIDYGEEIDHINRTLEKTNQILIFVIAVLIIMCLGIFLDTVYFHMTTDRWFIQYEKIIQDNLKK